MKRWKRKADALLKEVLIPWEAVSVVIASVHRLGKIL